MTTSAAAIGACSEMIVCADLLAKGYDVFCAVSPMSSSCDVVILNDGKPYRVEVRTARRSGWCRRSGSYDIFAAVKDGTVTYEPELPPTANSLRQAASEQLRQKRVAKFERIMQERVPRGTI